MHKIIKIIIGTVLIIYIVLVGMQLMGINLL
jgi:hypothetical protein